jgi:hypothetical protein
VFSGCKWRRLNTQISAVAKFELTVHLKADVIRDATVAYWAQRKLRATEKAGITMLSWEYLAGVTIPIVIAIWAWFGGIPQLTWLVIWIDGGFVSLFVAIWLVGRLRRALLSRKLESALRAIGTRTWHVSIRLDDENLTFGHGPAQRVIPWSDFREAVERPGFLLLTMHPSDFVIVPTEGLHEGIVEFIRSRITVWGHGA